MKLHHYAFVGRDLGTLQRRFRAESADELTPAIADPVQRVYVQFFRDRITGEVWEIVAPLDGIEGSPLASRIQRGGGLDHVSYELEASDGGIEAVVDAERKAGAQVVCAPVHAAAFDRRIAFILRRSGRVIEYVEERAPGAPV